LPEGVSSLAFLALPAADLYRVGLFPGIEIVRESIHAVLAGRDNLGLGPSDDYRVQQVVLGLGVLPDAEFVSFHLGELGVSEAVLQLLAQSDDRPSSRAVTG